MLFLSFETEYRLLSLILVRSEIGCNRSEIKGNIFVYKSLFFRLALYDRIIFRRLLCLRGLHCIILDWLTCKSWSHLKVKQSWEHRGWQSTPWFSFIIFVFGSSFSFSCRFWSEFLFSQMSLSFIIFNKNLGRSEKRMLYDFFNLF